MCHRRPFENVHKYHFFLISYVFLRNENAKKYSIYSFVNQMTWNLAQKSIIIPFRSSLNMIMIGWKVINLWRLILEKPGFVKNCRIFRYLCYILIRSNFTCFSAVLLISSIKNDQVIRPWGFQNCLYIFHMTTYMSQALIWKWI